MSVCQHQLLPKPVAVTRVYQRRQPERNAAYHYKAILVDKDSYLLELCRYVVLNPVRAKMVKMPGDWQWSSFLITMGKYEGFEGLATDAVLLQFGSQRSQAIDRFQAFILQGIGEDIWHNLKHQIYLGDDKFVEKHMKFLVDYEGKLSEVPKKQLKV